MSRPDVAIVGGGAIGVCCAYELARRGADVVLYERGPGLASGCSAGNAGLICPSHSAPIANPASVRNGLRWMWKRDSPFYLRPRPAVLPWLARFTLAARGWRERERVIRSLSLESLELHAALGAELGTSFERTGTLNVYATPEGLEAAAREAEASGLRHEVLDADATRALEPSLVGPVVGSTRFPDEGRVDPRRFVDTLGRAAAAAGAEIRTGAEVRSLDDLDADTVVVAAGAWSRTLVDLPLEGGKGYHVDYERSGDDPRIPAWIQETWTIATPLPDRLRLSGTLELAGLDLTVSPRRVDAIRSGAERWFRGLASRRQVETWAGLRPCLPDGLPAIGRLGRAVVATGHAMKGVSLAPVTGRLVAQLIAGETPSVDPAPFDPARF
ncbi:MAG TPA: FAD-dependent oxidoreductase [Gaiellaceae bacterium]|nr:FAD-dependent oxidoreductase [Gaiellaceae bacterium]